MRRTRLLSVLAPLILAGCYVGTAGDPSGGAVETGKATRFVPVEPALAAEVAGLLPAGIGRDALRLGNDGCYYYRTGTGQMLALRRDGNPEHFSCIG